ncbi:unnamed protein product [Albugo candida]|uniref:Uncharacterized protein n=1 Tax=Albugo candida TaxID=65357 RepID=A0A024FT42_9STRA|nr:unnamed protein product [Albugo candida]|eukprot:CCI10253.1 unnamed protein product [Albugo candida]
MIGCIIQILNSTHLGVNDQCIDTFFLNSTYQKQTESKRQLHKPRNDTVKYTADTKSNQRKVSIFCALSEMAFSEFNPVICSCTVSCDPKGINSVVFLAIIDVPEKAYRWKMLRQGTCFQPMIRFCFPYLTNQRVHDSNSSLNDTILLN